MPQLPSSNPTPEQILERSQAIQAEWCEQERRRRIADDCTRRCEDGEYSFPTVRTPRL